MPKHARKSRGRPQSHAVPAIPEGTYLIEKILNMKIEEGQRQYLIKWQGYDDPNDNTWEPLANLQNLTQDIIDYERAHATHIKRIENRWRKMHEDQEVSEPLQELDLDKMQEDLDRALEDLSVATPESEPPLRQRNTQPKAKPIAKQKPSEPKTRSRRQTKL